MEVAVPSVQQNWPETHVPQFARQLVMCASCMPKPAKLPLEELVIRRRTWFSRAVDGEEERVSHRHVYDCIGRHMRQESLVSVLWGGSAFHWADGDWQWGKPPGWPPPPEEDARRIILRKLGLSCRGWDAKAAQKRT